MPTLELVPIFCTTRVDMLGALALRLEKIFRFEVIVRQPYFDPETSFDVGRGQYKSTTILEGLLSDKENKAKRVLGIAGVDLFIPVLTYVFGEAQLCGRAAVVSMYRLEPSIYGLPNNDRQLFNRLLKESVHELGHTFGLLHCHNQRCVMRSSTYVEDIDLKSENFCRSCRKELNLDCDKNDFE
ncbi:archaemetzincin family Zn-dependent metalloprotease [Myxococcota bacterium]|nr:archaemetzincin family Zn-dependent metalloprotease [Myxococcota bacterium]